MRLPRRLAVMMTLAATLYLGPFLAGLSRQDPFGSILLFGALLGLWSVLYQPGSWPRRVAELAEPAILVRTLLVAGMMLFLAAVLFLAGTGLSTITGALPLPAAAPVAVTLGALALAVLVQSPRKAAEMDAFLDDALRQLQGLEAPPSESHQSAEAELLARRISGLPDDASPEDVLGLIRGSGDLDAALLSAFDRMGKAIPRPARIAAILLVTDSVRGSGLGGRAEAAWVFDLAAGDPELESLFAGRALALLSEKPHLWRDMPYSYDVNQVCSAASDPGAAALLAALRDRLNQLSAEEE
jgi:hypothetical protein